MSRIEQTFIKLRAAHRKALIPFITAGDPSPAHTVPLMHALVTSGADVLELGIPFSDPMADGPTIQRASERALKHGVSLRDVLALTKEFRKTDSVTPVVLMGYANPIEAMGLEAFAEAASQAGVDGVLTVDYPPEECGAFADTLKTRGLDMIFLLSPTTPEARVQEVARLASGFIYYVSLKGVTGSANLDMTEVAAKIPVIQSVAHLPIGVGFGIRDGATAAAVARVADAVVVGSRIVQAIEEAAPEQMLEQVSKLVREFRDAMDQVQS